MEKARMTLPQTLSRPGRLRMICLAVGVVLVAGMAASVAPRAEGKRVSCGDGRDNDRDGFADANDPGCKSGKDRSEIDKRGPACDNGRDDDGDSTIDEGGGKKKRKKKRAVPDAGCEGPTDTDEAGASVACNDGRDNEPDGLIDLSDPGCSGPTDTTETDPNGPECDNARDDDADSRSDFRTNGTGDDGCTNVSDDTESGGGGGGGGGGNPGTPPVNPPVNPPPATPRTLTCTPDSHDFGTVPLGESRFQDVTCTANGPAGAIVNVTGITITGSSAYIVSSIGNCSDRSLAVGQTCRVTVRYRPTSGSRDNGTLTFTHDGSNPAEVTTFTGIGFLFQG